MVFNNIRQVQVCIEKSQVSGKFELVEVLKYLIGYFRALRLFRV